MPSDPLTELGQSDRARLESFLVEFDLGWEPSRLATAAANLPSAGPFRVAALLELVKIDLERQAQLGTPVALESYFERFPELHNAGTLITDSVLADAEVDTAHLPTAKQPLTSTQLPENFGRYRILRRLGRGGMGSVYLAQDTELDRQVALKVPHFRPEDTVAAERFAREARAAATIDHPNVCRVYDVGRIDNTPYLTMAYVEGPTLADQLMGGPLSPRRAVEVARDAALALEEAHRRGVVHRDLKPGNILIGPKGQPVVADFGLARRDNEERRLTAEGEIVGTPLYMSPEQLTGDTVRIGPATDVYSLGAVLYEMLTGRPPFEGSRSDVFQQALTREPKAPSAIVSNIGARLDAIVLRAIAKRPGQRFASMSEFAAALDDWLRTDAPSTQESSRRWLSIVAIAALAILALIAAADRFGLLKRSQPNPPVVAPAPNGENHPPEPASEPKTVATGMLPAEIQRPLAVSFSDDGRHINFGVLLRDNRIAVRSWELASGKERPLVFEPLACKWLTFAPDGSRFLVGGAVDRVGLYSSSSNQLIHEFKAGPNAIGGAVSRDGRRIVIGGADQAGKPFVRVVDAVSGDEIRSYFGHKKIVQTVALSDDGAWAFSASADRYAIWDVSAAKQPVESSGTIIKCAAFIPGTKWCVIGAATGEITLFDVSADALQLLTFPDRPNESVHCLAGSADGRLLIAGSVERTIRVYETANGKERWRLPDGSSAVIGVAFSPESRRVAACMADRTWQVWELPESK